MPRKTSSHKMSAPATSVPAPATAPAPAPSSAPPQPNLASTMLQGFSFGAGQSLAYNTFRSDPKEVNEVKETNEPKEQKEPNPKNLSNCIKNEECNKLLESFLNMEFIQCMKDNKYEDCKHLI